MDEQGKRFRRKIRADLLTEATVILYAAIILLVIGSIAYSAS